MFKGFLTKSVFYPPNPACYTKSHPGRVTMLTTETGKLIPAHFFPAKRKCRTTMIYSHGNAEDIGSTYARTKKLQRELKFVNVLSYEYLGYGLAKDEGCSENHTYESLAAAVNFLVNEIGIEYKDIVLYGRSLGSGPSCEFASSYPFRGLVLEAPIMSCVRVVSGSVKALSTVLDYGIDMFQNINKVDKIQSPVMIFHGNEDKVVPLNHGQGLWERVRSECKYRFIKVDGGSHQNIPTKIGYPAYINHLTDFLLHCKTHIKKKKQRERARQRTSQSQPQQPQPQQQQGNVSSRNFSSSRLPHNNQSQGGGNRNRNNIGSGSSGGGYSSSTSYRQ